MRFLGLLKRFFALSRALPYDVQFREFFMRKKLMISAFKWAKARLSKTSLSDDRRISQTKDSTLIDNHCTVLSMIWPKSNFQKNMKNKRNAFESAFGCNSVCYYQESSGCQKFWSSDICLFHYCVSVFSSSLWTLTFCALLQLSTFFSKAFQATIANIILIPRGEAHFDAASSSSAATGITCHVALDNVIPCNAQRIHFKGHA